MHLLVLANEKLKEEFLGKPVDPECTITLIKTIDEVADKAVDAIFVLTEMEEFNQFHLAVPVFLNSTTKTLKELELPNNFSRFAGWPGLLQRDTWEIATTQRSDMQVLDKLNWKYIIVNDEPGFVSARTITMIINEAYFALGDGVSTKDEIDLAMKLGTNYPFGPFEWSRKIGLKNIYSLLKKLSEKDIRYIIAPSLEREVNENDN